MFDWFSHRSVLAGQLCDSQLLNCLIGSLSAAAVAWALVRLLGPNWIAWLRPRFGERISIRKRELAELHAAKQNTPTMGGLPIVAALLCAMLVCGRPDQPVLWLAVFLLVALTALGAVDDWTKATGRSAAGLSAGTKLAWQIAIAATVVGTSGYLSDAPNAGWVMHEWTGTMLPIPHYWMAPLAVLVIVGSCNAVNLTDGLDGLAAGCLIASTFALCGGALLLLSNATNPAAGEVAVVAAAMTGALVGFLRFNRHPAQLFMGDAGSLPLGGLLGWLAVASGQILLLAVFAGVFVVEALSVIVQLTTRRLTGRRPLRCAPLHHHFQLVGWPEPLIVKRFWLAGGICAAAGLLLAAVLHRANRETAAGTHNFRSQPSAAVAALPQQATTFKQSR